MKLYIQIINGVAVNHPILEDNLLMFYTPADLANSAEYVPFTRVAQPQNPYAKNFNSTYEIVNGVYQDVWTPEIMNAQEVLEKQFEAKQAWLETGYISWTFNEATCSFDPPMTYPTDGKVYIWSEPTLAWVEVVN